MKGIGPTKTSGEDDFSTLFFQKCWHNVGKDITSYFLAVLNYGKALDPLNVTNIMLILKIPYPMNLANSRLISLCNALYKVITKRIANRFQRVLEDCIDGAQSTFVPGQLILDNVLLTYEILHSFHGEKSFMPLKLDMSKTYDRVECDFLKVIMDRMGFGKAWLKMIMRCITSVLYSVIINGKVGESFKPSKDLRQGDLLSPFLFQFAVRGC